MSPKTSNTIDVNYDVPYNDEFPNHAHQFHPEALKVFKTRTKYLLHQYNESSNKWPELYNTIELLGLFGLKTAQVNPLEGTFRRRVAQVKFFGFTCRKADIEKAKLKLIGIINDMAASGWLKASLCDLGSLELGVNPMFPSIKDRVAVFSYLAVDPDSEGYVNSTYKNMQFTEGGMPPVFK